MIDGHSHLLMSSSGCEKRKVSDLTEVDLGVLVAGLDRLGIERVVSLVNLVLAKEYGVIDRVIWGSDYDVYWHDDWDFSGYFRKVSTETEWLRSGANEVLRRCGWPTLADDEIAGILDTNVRRLMRIEPMQELETGGGGRG